MERSRSNLRTAVSKRDPMISFDFWFPEDSEPFAIAVAGRTVEQLQSEVECLALFEAIRTN